MNNLTLSITDVAIRQDAEGRFCLNDLHRAAGGSPAHQLSNWTRLEQTAALTEVAQKEIPQIRVIESKQGLGTFAVKELVYAYAMWVSPEFHFQVIRTFDAASQRQAALQFRPRQLANQILEDELQTASLLGIPLHFAQLEAVKTVHRETGLDYRPLLALAPAQNTVAQEDVMLEPADLAKRLGLRDGATVNRWLEACGLQSKVGSSWVATDEGKKHSSLHQWNTMFKSGYNLKWSLDYLSSLLQLAISDSGEEL